MIRFAFPCRTSIAALAGVTALGIFLPLGTASAGDPLVDGSAANAGSPAPAALEILDEARRLPTLTERFGLPRVSGPIQLGLPPVAGEPILGLPLAARRPPQRADSAR